MFPIGFSTLWSDVRTVLIALAAAVGLSACGFQPIHDTSPMGAAANEQLAAIKVDPIKERVGQMLRNNLLDSINPRGEPARPAYRLLVEVSENKQELAVRKSEFATRSNLLLTATYRLIQTGSEGNKQGGVVMSRTSSVAASYNLLTNEFATLAAEADARERGTRDLAEDITRQLALFVRSQARAEKR